MASRPVHEWNSLAGGPPRCLSAVPQEGRDIEIVLVDG